MSRSRAYNRFNRLVAKTRRTSLDAEMPFLKYGPYKEAQSINNFNELQLKALNKEITIDLLDLEAK